MVKSLNRANPSGQTLLEMLQASGGTGTYYHSMMVRVPLAATSTASAATNWVNPESGTVVATAWVTFRTAGTGTFNVGRGSDGTGSAVNMINAGTMTVGVHYPGTVLGTVDASSTTGGLDRIYFLLGPGGTGTNNSINMTHSDTTTSTAAGELIVWYFPVIGT